MGLFDRISASRKKQHSNFDIKEKLFYSVGLNNALRTNTNTYTKTQIPQVYDNELALNFPAQFIYRYLNRSTIENAIKINPNIEKILYQSGLECRYYPENVNSIIMSHLIPTARKAKETYLNMGHSKNESNYLYLVEASLLHDIGKVFIPPDILNKKGKLSRKERKIIELHNRLSYEILITTSLNPKVAQLAYEHHNYDKKVKPNDENQVLTMADIYSALKEERSYKKALDNFMTRTILYDMAAKGAFDIKYMTYLKF